MFCRLGDCRVCRIKECLTDGGWAVFLTAAGTSDSSEPLGHEEPEEAHQETVLLRGQEVSH